MKVLKEAEAVSYLDRVYDCLKNPAFEDITLLKMMVGMQRAYLTVLLHGDEQVRDFAKIRITPTGFPELDSWAGDIRRAAAEYGATVQLRSKVILPVLDQVRAHQESGLSLEELSVQLSKDQILASVFGIEFTKPQQRLLDKIKSAEGGLNVKEDPKYPGFLFIKHRINRFGEGHESLVKYIDQGWGETVIPTEEGESQQTILYAPILLRYHDYEGSMPDGGYPHFRDLRAGNVLGNANLDSSSHALTPNFRRFLLFSDFTEGGTPAFATALEEIHHFDHLLKILDCQLNELLGGRSLDHTNYIQNLNNVYSKLQKAIDNASIPEVKGLFKDALDAKVNSVQQEAEDTAIGARGTMVERFDRSSKVGRAWRKIKGW